MWKQFMDHFFRGSGCFSGYQMNSRKSFLFLNPAASAKCFQNAKLPAKSGNAFRLYANTCWYGLDWFGMVLPAMACGCMRLYATTSFSFQQIFTQHIVPHSYKPLYFAFCGVFVSGGQLYVWNIKMRHSAFWRKIKGIRSRPCKINRKQPSSDSLSPAGLLSRYFLQKKAKIAGAERKLFFGSTPTLIGLVLPSRVHLSMPVAYNNQCRTPLSGTNI